MNWGFCQFIGGECTLKKDEILIGIVNTVQSSQSKGLDRQQSANEVLKKVLEKLGKSIRLLGLFMCAKNS